MNNATSNESYEWRKCQFPMQIPMLKNEINTKFDSYYEPFQLLLLHFSSNSHTFSRIRQSKKNVVAYLFPEMKSIAVIFRKRLHLLIEGWRCTLQPFHQVQNVIAIDEVIGGIGDEQHECTDSSSTTSLSLLAFEWNSRMFENAFKNSYTNAISDRCFEY